MSIELLNHLRAGAFVYERRGIGTPQVVEMSQDGLVIDERLTLVNPGQ